MYAPTIATVKQVKVLITIGGLQEVDQWLVKIGSTTISTHNDEASAIAAMNEANEQRNKAIDRLVRKNIRSY